jgi:two-component system, sensor histidine kinase and response regulator
MWVREPGDMDGSQVASQSTVAILVVDDDPLKRLALKALLKPLGYSIIEADSGVAALRCVVDQEFAVILLDVRMPIMDGIETATLIRQRVQTELTPIIFVTAHEHDEIANMGGYAAGAVDLISGPIQPDELRAKVQIFANLFVEARRLAADAGTVQAFANQMRVLGEVAPIGIFMTDFENRFVYTNPRWSEITGIPSEEVIGQSRFTVVDAQFRSGHIAALPDGSVDQSELCYRTELQLPGLAKRVVLVNSKAILNSEGETEGWVGTLADVTAEARADAAMSHARDEATEASQLKSDFLANMSHEIRTPMNGVIGMADLLLETDLDTRQRDYAQTVRNSGEALLTIINDILDFSRLEAGKLEIEDVPFSVRAIVDGVVDLLARSSQVKGLELVSVVENSVPAVVRGDPGRLRQVLTNLIGNAIKFTQIGEVVVRVTGTAAGAEFAIHFEVSDTGDGVAPDKLSTIFQPFVQADTSTSRKYGGAGLGLSISGQLVTLMGGDSDVCSQLGVGSTFKFTIRADADASSSTEQSPAPPYEFAEVNALIVDDNATQRSVLSQQLIEWGMIVVTADSATAALAKLREAATRGRPFALALIDRFMPDMDGLELTDAIQRDLALTVRLILMTGLGQEGDVAAATASRISAVLSKPIHRDTLCRSLRAALGLGVIDMIPQEVAPKSPLLGEEREAGRILLVEDNLINQKVAVAILSTANYYVDAVLNGAEAVRAAASQPYDAILMDCQMPGMNGYEATIAIRAQERQGRHIPIIAMTAGARREDRDRCLSAGMDSYLSKPVSKDALLTQVAMSVDN